MHLTGPLAGAALAALALSLAAAAPSAPSAPSTPAAPSAPSSSWLGLLPDGETKRRFIVDCTGCHQFDGRIAQRDGRMKTEAEFAEAVGRMLGFAGPETSFPVISSAQHPARTAAWLAAALEGGTPPDTTRAATTATATTGAAVEEFLFPAPQDLPHDVAVDSAGRVVVTGMFTHQMYVLDPAAAEPARRWSQVPIPVERANPRAVELDRQGRWWVVLGGPGKVARYDGREWATFDVGMYAHSVALDSAGGAWVNGHFTRDPEQLAQVTADGAVRTVDLPRHPALAARPGGPIPYEIRTAPDGALWMSELQGDRLVRHDPKTGRSEAFALPTPHSAPRRFDVDAQGVLWIPAYGAGTLVRFDPAAPAGVGRGRRFEEIALPVKDAAPYVARADARRGVVWIGTGAADALFAYHPRTRRFETVTLPSRGALVRHLALDPRSGDVWLAYGESPGKLPSRIARVRMPR